jgi:hypothetical protein
MGDGLLEFHSVRRAVELQQRKAVRNDEAGWLVKRRSGFTTATHLQQQD